MNKSNKKHFVLIVEFDVAAEKSDTFVHLVRENARRSVQLEPGCHQFDVVRAISDKTNIKLYEVYEDEDALNAHIGMAHVADFFRDAKPLILSQTTHRLERLSA